MRCSFDAGCFLPVLLADAVDRATRLAKAEADLLAVSLQPGDALLGAVARWTRATNEATDAYFNLKQMEDVITGLEVGHDVVIALTAAVRRGVAEVGDAAAVLPLICEAAGLPPKPKTWTGAQAVYACRFLVPLLLATSEERELLLSGEQGLEPYTLPE